MVLDNYATHKQAKVLKWLAKHPRFHMHFTATSASWMNMVERFFRNLSEDRLKRGVFRSVTRVYNGRACILETALGGDVALVEAWMADRWGNLIYRDSSRNFNPIMAQAAKLTIVQTHHIADLGQLPANEIVTPGIFVHRVLHVAAGDPQLPA